MREIVIQKLSQNSCTNIIPQNKNKDKSFKNLFLELCQCFVRLWLTTKNLLGPQLIFFWKMLICALMILFKELRKNNFYIKNDACKTFVSVTLL